jgi:hypothetical protein
MVRRLLMVATVAAGLAFASVSVTLAGKQAQTPGKQTVSDKAQSARGSGDNDANVKTKAGPNDPAAKFPAPAGKGGDKTRGAACTVNFDNWTSWYIEVYVDGNYWGVVGPWSDMDTIAGNGATRALFRDGSMKYWGPRNMNCAQGGYYTWELHQ